MDFRGKVEPITVTRGDSWRFHVTYGNPAEDLTGATITAQLRSSADAQDVVELDVTEDDYAEGTFWVGQDEAPPDAGVYDVQIVFPSGERKTFIGGKFTADADVTRP